MRMGHRFYSYRIKRLGCSWTAKVTELVGSLLIAERNGILDIALQSEIDEHIEPLEKDIKGAVRSALKKTKTETVRVKTGKISNYASASSFAGILARMFS